MSWSRLLETNLNGLKNFLSGGEGWFITSRYRKLRHETRVASPGGTADPEDLALRVAPPGPPAAARTAPQFTPAVIALLQRAGWKLR